MPTTSHTRRRRPRCLSQLALWEGGRPAEARADLLPTRPLLQHRSCPRVLDLIRQVRTFFPELDGVSLKIGLTRRAAGLASRDEPWIWINPRRLTRHTIAHEMVHLLQFRGLVPTGEKSADLYALARDCWLADDLPFYLQTPRALRLACQEGAPEAYRLLHRLARESLTRREQGERTYLRWFERELAARWIEAVPVAVEPAPPIQASLF